MNTNPALLKSFDERVIWFLLYLYENGGNVYRAQHNYSSFKSSRIPEAANPNEFDRLMYALKSKGWATWIQLTGGTPGENVYIEVLLTEEGIKAAETNLGKSPLAGLLLQVIQTGEVAIDEKLNHARSLFFSDPPTLDNMRNGCETLCFVLEPLRDDLNLAIASADVNSFFQIVNTFDIRHNKPFTKNLVHPEQLEWVFYSLLNTINTYTKLKKRLNL